MALPTSVARKPLHTRDIKCSGFLRDDGLWDLEGELTDLKGYVYEDRERGDLPVGHPMHHMKVRLTIDNNMTVQEVHTDLVDTPFQYCMGVTNTTSGLIGAVIGPGWRRIVDTHMKGVKGCSHIRELLYVLATVAFQTVSPYREQFMKELGAPQGAEPGAPFFLNQCYSWDKTSPVVLTYFPDFHKKSEDS